PKPPGRCLPFPVRHLYYPGTPSPAVGPRARRAARGPGGKAIISDIPRNPEGLQALLAGIKAQGITDGYCPGDAVGYDPHPRECIDLVMDCKLCLLGNHDQGAMFDPDGFNQSAEKAIFWTRAQLESTSEARATREKRWDYLAERPRSHRENGFLYVHG